MNVLFRFTGVVVSNKKRGASLGFPTANIPVPAEIPDGIYAGVTVLDGKELPSAIFIGKAEHYKEKRRFAESYLLDFSGDLYGKNIELRLTKKLRESTLFASEEALVRQIRQDIAMVRELFTEGRTTSLSSPLTRGNEAESGWSV